VPSAAGLQLDRRDRSVGYAPPAFSVSWACCLPAGVVRSVDESLAKSWRSPVMACVFRICLQPEIQDSQAASLVTRHSDSPCRLISFSRPAAAMVLGLILVGSGGSELGLNCPGFGGELRCRPAPDTHTWIWPCEGGGSTSGFSGLALAGRMPQGRRHLPANVERSRSWQARLSAAVSLMRGWATTAVRYSLTIIHDDGKQKLSIRTTAG